MMVVFSYTLTGRCSLAPRGDGYSVHHSFRVRDSMMQLTPARGLPLYVFSRQISIILLTIRTLSAILHGEHFLLWRWLFLNELTLQATFGDLLCDTAELAWRAGGSRLYVTSARFPT